MAFFATVTRFLLRAGRFSRFQSDHDFVRDIHHQGLGDDLCRFCRLDYHRFNDCPADVGRSWLDIAHLLNKIEFKSTQKFLHKTIETNAVQQTWGAASSVIRSANATWSFFLTESVWSWPAGEPSSGIPFWLRSFSLRMLLLSCFFPPKKRNE